MQPLLIGQLRPSMVMLDQIHPQGGEIAHLARGDGFASPDILLVLGTSLKVDGQRSCPGSLPGESVGKVERSYM